MNKYTQYPPTKHPEPFVIVSITIEDKSYDAYYSSEYGWRVDLNRDNEYWFKMKESELGYWIYGTNEPKKIIP